ncbi:hypothetical protein A2U01_0082850, partial [Trifolium medium]|nr:hypothetical protein [Trifolium medium]
VLEESLRKSQELSGPIRTNDLMILVFALLAVVVEESSEVGGGFQKHVSRSSSRSVLEN